MAVHYLRRKEVEAKAEKVGSEVTENLECQAEFRQWNHSPKVVWVVTG